MTSFTTQALARETARKIRSTPQRFNQRVYVGQLDGPRTVELCSTTACCAGWIVILHDQPTPQAIIEASHSSMSGHISVNGASINIPHRAAELLELSANDAGWLFAGGRSKAQVLEVLDRLGEGKPAGIWKTTYDVTLTAHYTVEATSQEEAKALAENQSAEEINIRAAAGIVTLDSLLAELEDDDGDED